MAAVGSGGSISDVLVNVANNPALVRIVILGDLLTSLGIVALAALLYVVLNKQGPIIALVAFGWWLVEAMALAVSKVGLAALIPLSHEFVQAGGSDQSHYLGLGGFLYHSLVTQLGSTTLMFFYCAGGVLWYYLFYKSRYIPRAISLFGLAAVSVSLVGIVFVLMGFDVPIIVFLPVLPFELTIGGWLVVRGATDGSEGAGLLARISSSPVERDANQVAA
jgi:hypothetical protein